MRAITVLMRCKSAVDEIRRLRQRIAWRREAAEGVSPRLEKTGTGGGDHGDRLAAFASAVDDLEREVAARERAWLAEKDAACRLLDGLPDNEANVLHAYYVQCKTAASIGRAIGYTEGHVRKLKAGGERALAARTEAEVAAALPAWYPEEWPDVR